jgi:hypothetical protein
MSSPLQRLLYNTIFVAEKTFKVEALVSVLVTLYNIIFVTEKIFKVDALVSVLVILHNIIFVAEKTFKVDGSHEVITVCVVYEQNRVDGKDTLNKTSVCVRTALLKRVFLRSK